jgi:glucose/arabinose dehydrogenase
MPSPLTRRPLALLAVAPFALGACADAGLPPTAPVGPPAASVAMAPNGGRAPLDQALVDPALCAAHGGFDVEIHITGAVRQAVRTGPDGTTRIVETLSNGRIVLSANGRRVAGNLAGSVVYHLAADGSLLDVTYNGNNGVFTLPGVGLLAAETGRLVLAPDRNVLWQAGPHDVFGAAPSTQRLCAALAP